MRGGNGSGTWRSRRWVSACGFAAASAASVVGSNIGVVVALTVAASGLISYMPPFLSLPPTFLGGTAAAGGIGLVSSLGRIGAMLGPSVVGYFRVETGDYSAAIATMAVGQVLAAVIVLGIGWTDQTAQTRFGAVTAVNLTAIPLCPCGKRYDIGAALRALGERSWGTRARPAGVVELADTRDLGSRDASVGG